MRIIFQEKEQERYSLFTFILGGAFESWKIIAQDGAGEMYELRYKKGTPWYRGMQPYWHKIET